MLLSKVLDLTNALLDRTILQIDTYLVEHDAIFAQMAKKKELHRQRMKLSADLARHAGPNRHAMTKDEIDAMWGHEPPSLS